MKEFIFKIFKLKQKYLYLLITLFFFIIAYHHLSSGFRMSSDSIKFSRYADDLIKFNFDLYEFFFTLPIFLIALCKILFVDKNPFIMVLFTIVSMSAKGININMNLKSLVFFFILH